MPRIPALRRSAPTVRFMTFDTLTTGVRALECALSSRKSSFVHGRTTRRVDFAGFTDLTVFALLAVFFATLAIAYILHFNSVHISMRRGENKATAFWHTFGIIWVNGFWSQKRLTR